MTEIATITQDQIITAPPVPSVEEARGALAAAIGAVRAGATPGVVKVDEHGTARLVPPSDETMAGAGLRLEMIEPLLGAAAPQDMLAWLCKLRHSVRGAPEGWRAILAKAEAIWEDCRDLPRGVWCDATRSLWRQQPARKDFLPGSQWPLPGELHAILLGYASQLRVEAEGCRQLLRVVAAPPEPEWQRPSEEERAALSASLRASGIPPLHDRTAPQDDDDTSDATPSTFGRAVGAALRTAADARSHAA